MKKILSIFVSVIMLICFNSITIQAKNAFYSQIDEIPDEVQNVAENSVDMLRKHYASNPDMFSFESKEEAMSLSLGEGYRVYYVGNLYESKILENAEKVSDLVDLDMQKAWLYTLDLGDMPRIYVLIGEEDGKYELTLYGGDATRFGLARQKINEITKSLEGVSPIKVISSGGEYFFYAKVGDEEIFVPESHFSDKTVTTYSDKNYFSSADEFINDLKDNREFVGYGSAQSATENNSNGTDMVLIVGASFAAMLFFVILVSFRKNKKKKQD